MPNSPTPAILAVDPGKTAAAFAFIGLDGTVLRVGMFNTPISELTQPHLTRQAVAFAKEVRALLTDPSYLVTNLVIERYQQRVGKSARGSTGAAIEFVNVIIGMILTIGLLSKPFVQLHPVTPVEWKNWMSQLVYGTTQKAKGGMENAAQAFGFTVTKAQTRVPLRDHELDAVGQGLWYVCSKLPRDQWKSVFETTKASLQVMWDAGLAQAAEIVAKKHASSSTKRRKPKPAGEPTRARRVPKRLQGSQPG